MEIKWHKLKDLAIKNFKDISNDPGIYFVRWSKNGEPVSIGRLGGFDPKGILYVGSAVKLRRRVRQLWKGINRQGRHTIGKTIIFCKVFEIVSLDEYEISWNPLETPEAAEGQEWTAIESYAVKYRETPPLNLILRRHMFAKTGLAITGKSRVGYEPDEFVRSVVEP